MSEIRIILVTCPDSPQSLELARELVHSKLASCVNLIPGVTSIYHWHNELHEDKEQLMVIKTSSERIAQLESKVLELHPYDTPEFVVIEPDRVNEKYLKWIIASID